MKRLVVCCDGTWQRDDQAVPTNVAKLAQTIITDNTVQDEPQIVEYSPGIGAGGNRFERLGGGAFGWGIDAEIKNVYAFLCLNYNEGDEIYLFGFSRGAYTVRSLAGLMRVAGGLLPSHEVDKVPEVYKIYRSRGEYNDRRDLTRKENDMLALSSAVRPAQITVLGCWDTVGSLGIPRTLPLLSRLLNKKYEFHDCQLSNLIKHALHAVALDERRTVFDYTPMEQSEKNIEAGQTLDQVWFPGDHGAVGGGNTPTAGLADSALLWMVHTIQNTLQLGLKFDLSNVEYHPDKVDRTVNRLLIHPNPEVYVAPENPSWLFRLTGQSPRTIPDDAALHESVFKRWHAPAATYRPSHLPSTLVAQLHAYVTV